MNSFSPFYVSHFQSMSLCSQPLIPPTLSIGHHTQAELQSPSTLQQEIWWTHTFTRHILHKIHHTKTRDGHHGMDWIRYNDLPEQKLYCKTLSKAQLTLALSTLTRLSAFYAISNLFWGNFSLSTFPKKLSTLDISTDRPEVFFLSLDRKA